MNRDKLKQIAEILPAPVHRWLQAEWRAYRYHPPLGKVRWGELRRLTPISSCWGLDRGHPIDRYYIENFLAHYAQDVQGRVLEIGDNSYTQRYGSDRVTQSDVLHIDQNAPTATIVADLVDADHIASNTFDCFILTQTLQLIYEVRLALKTVYRILKPGGVVLATIPGITPISDHEWQNAWCWSFTTRSARQLFEEVFPADAIEIETFGNVLSATAFLQGMAAEELQMNELDYRDPGYEVTITVRAVKPR
jgi:SAM-dependent methyltransferase